MQSSRLQGIASAFLGNVLEFYGLTLYAGFMTEITREFLPSGENWFLGMFLFCASFVVRPLGGAILGRIADIKGRKFVLIFSVLGMGISSMVLAVLPSYQTVGVFSLVVLVIIRILQGFFVSAEFSGGLTYVLEQSSSKMRPLLGGLVSMSSWVGMSLAFAFVKLAVFLPEWGWRLGFLIDGLATVLALIMRRTTPETDEFLEKKSLKYKVDKKEVTKLTWHVILITLTNSTGAYILTGFSFLYCVKFLHLDVIVTKNLTAFFMPFTIVMPFIGGVLVYFFNPMRVWRSFLVIGAAVAVSVFVWVSYTESLVSIKAMFLTVSAMCGLSGGITPIILYKLLPVKWRMTTMSLGVNISVSVGGGVFPLIYTFLLEQSHINYIPGLFAGFVMMISLASTFWVERKMLLDKKPGAL